MCTHFTGSKKEVLRPLFTLEDEIAVPVCAIALRPSSSSRLSVLGRAYCDTSFLCRLRSVASQASLTSRPFRVRAAHKRLVLLFRCFIASFRVEIYGAFIAFRWLLSGCSASMVVTEFYSIWFFSARCSVFLSSLERTEFANSPNKMLGQTVGEVQRLKNFPCSLTNSRAVSKSGTPGRRLLQLVLRGTLHQACAGTSKPPFFKS